MAREITCIGRFGILFAVAGCPGGPQTASETPPDASSDAPVGCDVTADAIAPEASGCVVDPLALFVNRDSGNDASDASKATPLMTIGAAIAKVPTSGKQRIYICGSGTYAEHLSISTQVNLYGGFDCANWKSDANAKVRLVAPDTTAPALVIRDVSAEVIVSDLDISSADAGGKKDGTSSIAVFATGSKVKFLRVGIHALNAADGADGVKGAQGVLETGGGTTGNPAMLAVGGQPKVCKCSTDPVPSTGGQGGGFGQNGKPGEPSYAATAPKNGAGGEGGLGSCSNNNGPGNDGADAPPAKNADPITTRGTLSSDGWVPANGAEGIESGKIGQGGGGGGGGSLNSATGGAGGGCGGCGGTKGNGGGGGGSSIAVLLSESAAKFETSALSTRAAGIGGKGGLGGSGSAGGATGAVGACLGGTGGRGADGGSGGGGAGGVSIGILYKGTRPATDAATSISVGQPGLKGAGGVPTNAGIDGIADKIKDAANL